MGKGSKKGGKKGGRKGMCVFAGAIMLMASPAFASPPSTVINNTYIQGEQDHDTTRQEFGYGLGADVTVFKSANPWVDSVEVQGRYDIENRETRVFGVVNVDLWDALKGGK